MAVRHDAFISYSHAADTRLAEALERGLEKLAKPLLKLRALDVFRDQTSLTASPALWPGIVTHLSASAWFLFMASPASAASVWCSKEVQWWLENRSPERMLMLLTEGDIGWDTATRDFDWARTTSLPRLLERRCADEPLYVDLRWARDSDLLSLRNAKFREAVVNVAAPIRGIPKDELDGADLRQLTRNRLFVRGGITLIAIAALVAAWQAVVATRQRAEAERQRAEAVRQRDIAVARQLAAQAELLRAQQPDRLPLALLMATQAARMQPESVETQQTLLALLTQLPRPVAVLPHSAMVNSAAFSTDLAHVATAAAGGGTLWSVPDARAVAPLPGVDRVAIFSPDDKLIAGCCQQVTVWTRKGEPWLALTSAALTGIPEVVTFSADSRRLAIGIQGQHPAFAVYDLESKQQLTRHEEKLSGNATAIAFAPNGELFVALRDTIEVYDPATWRLARTLTPKLGAIHRLAFSPNGRFLAMSSLAKVVVMDLEQDTIVRLEGHERAPGQVLDLRFDPRGAYLSAVGDLNTGSIWRVGTWRPVAAVGHGEFQTIHTLSFNPVADEAVSCATDGTCLGWSLTTGARTYRFAHVYPHTGAGNETRQIASGAFGSGRSLFVSAGVDRTARIWSLAGAVEHSLARCELPDVLVRTFVAGTISRHCRVPQPSDTRSVPVVADDGRAAAVMVPFDTVRVWDPTTGKPLATLTHADPVDWDAVKARLSTTLSARPAEMRLRDMRDPGSVVVLAVSRSGGRVATFRDADQTLRVWDTVSSQVVYREVLKEPPALRFLSDTTLLRTDEPGTLSVRTLPAGAAVWSADLGRLRALVVTDDTRLVAALGQDTKDRPDVSLRVWDIASGTRLLERAVDAEAGGLQFDASGRYLAVTSRFGEVPTGLPVGVALSLWDVAAGRAVVSLPKDAGIIALAHSRDARFFATVGTSGALQVWDLSTGTSRQTVTADPGPVAFSTTGRWLAVGSQSVRVLDVATLNPLAQLDLGGEIRAIEFQADDAIIAALRVDSGETAGLIERHHWRTADMLAEACRRLPVAAAEGQWRQLLGDQAVPKPCAAASAPLSGVTGTR